MNANEDQELLNEEAEQRERMRARGQLKDQPDQPASVASAPPSETTGYTSEEADEQDDLDIGTIRGGSSLVCYGDDQPDQFATWLVPMVERFVELRLLAEESDADLDPKDGQAPVDDLVQFCERLGIEFDSKFWEGSVTSGHYRYGWLAVGSEEEATETATVLLEELAGSLRQ